jgi:chemotaxis protein CheC
MERDFSDVEKARLAEVMKIGASTAATALSRMLGKWVNVSLPRVYIGSPEKAERFLGRTDILVSTVLMKVTGDLQGYMMALFPAKSAAGLAGLLQKRQRSAEAPDEMDRSAIREAGNIAVGAALMAFSKFIGIRLIMSVPDAATEMLGSVIDGIVAELGSAAEQVLVFRIDLAVEGHAIDGMFLFLFDHSAAQTILDAAGRMNLL